MIAPGADSPIGGDVPPLGGGLVFRRGYSATSLK